MGDVTAQPPGTPVPLDTLLAHREWVRALARSLVRDEHRADDVEQETWRMALERPPRHAGSLRAWFGTVVRNAARGAGRRAASRARFESMAVARAGVPSPDEVVAEAEVQHRLVEAVLALDEPYRTTVLLRWFQGLETSEIAARLGEPVETVRTRLKRAVERLRRRMEVELGDDRDAWVLLLWGHRAPTSGPATGTGAAPLAAAGGLAMGAATKLAAGAAAAIVLAALAWTVTRSGSESSVQTAASDTTDAHAGPRAARVQDGAAAADSAPAPSESTPGAVDLASADRDLDLCGEVVDSDGKPIADAEIAVLAFPWRRIFLLTMDAFADGRRTVGGRTDKAGRFSFRLTRGAAATLRVRAPGFAETDFDRLQAGERARLVLPRAARLVVLVKDEAGAAVSGAAIEVESSLRFGGTSYRRDATTGDDGRAAFDVPADTSPTVRVQKTGFPYAFQQPHKGEPLRSETEMAVTLVRGTRIAGRVTDATTGAVVAGARVGAGWTLADATTTDADGRYALPIRLESEDVVTVLADGYARAARKATAEGELDFALAPGDAIVGRVVDESGSPVAGALVAAIATRNVGDGQEFSSGAVETGADGRFRLGNLRRDWAHALVLQAAGRGRRTVDVAPSDDTRAQRDVGDVALAPGRTIEVRVVGVDGKPLARHPLTLESERTPASPADTYYGRSEERMTDDLGRARFPDLGPGDYVVDVAEPEQNHLRRTVAIGASDPPPVVVSFESDYALRVRVVDEAGVFVPGFYAQVEFDGAPAQGRDVGADGAEFASKAVPRRVTSFGRTREARESFLPPKPVVVPRGRGEVTVVVRRAAQISGKVLDPSGAPLAGASVCARRGVTDLWAAASKEDGTFVIALPADVTVDVTFEGVYPPRAADAPPLVASALGVTPGTTGLVLATREDPRDRTLRVRVVDPTGAPVVGAKVYALPAGARQFEIGETDASGVAVIEKLCATTTFVHLDMGVRGEYAWTKRWARARGTSVLPAGQEITLRLLEATHLRGKVLDAEGKPAPGAYVDALSTGFAANGKSGDDGTFDLLVPVDETEGFRLLARLFDGRKQLGESTLEGVRPEDAEVVVRLAPR